MAEINMAKAKAAYALLCKMLDNRNLHYERIAEDLVIRSNVTVDVLPVDFIMRINPRNEIVSFISRMPFKTDESKRIDMALAICAANYGLADGSFDYSLADGTILFRLTSSYRGIALSEELLEYMLMVAVSTVNEYNNKFFMISEGELTVQQFIESEQASD